MTFLYVALTRTVNILRMGLEKRKNNSPLGPDYSDYWQGFLILSWRVLFAHESNVRPIENHERTPVFPYLVYSFWGFLVSVFGFSLSGVIFSWLVISGNLDGATDVSVLIELIQNSPLGLLELLHSVVPIMDGLAFRNRIIVGGVVFVTGFIFLTCARNITAVSEELHKRALLFLVENNPIFQNEFLNMIILSAPYVILLSVM
ncbi:hypothetical protein [Haloparvum sp. PAK95]|uniref:hypothetical protein n=1 Tax=Haloparvum sp. PAK95 TaxID=3418962 RepID=UPI003D2ED133